VQREESAYEAAGVHATALASGTHTHSLLTGEVAISGGPFKFFNPVLIAQFVPFGGNGLAASLGASPIRTSPNAKTVPEVSTTTR
jgi:hypothetical protein